MQTQGAGRGPGAVSRASAFPAPSAWRRGQSVCGLGGAAWVPKEARRARAWSRALVLLLGPVPAGLALKKEQAGSWVHPNLGCCPYLGGRSPLPGSPPVFATLLLPRREPRLCSDQGGRGRQPRPSSTHGRREGKEWTGERMPEDCAPVSQHRAGC